jgi:hypothetical protein
MNYYLKSLFLLLFLNSSVCFSQKSNAGYLKYENECMGVELDGSETIKAWGKGKDRKDAVEQAKKNGVRDVLFKGIFGGSNECNQVPLISESSVRLNNEDYFNLFFADGGAYKDFVSMKDESIKPKIMKDKKKAGTEVVEGVIIRVLRSELKKKLKSDGILK